jgi:prephenate dehydratase
MQSQQVITVAFQGVAGAYSEEAAASLGPSVQAEGLPSFAEVFAAVQSGRCAAGVVPIENSLAGTVYQVIDLLYSSDLYVVGEAMVRVRHQLLARPGTRLEQVQEVLSHPQALDQCAGYLRRMGLRAVPAYDTAGAALQLLEREDQRVACIASRRAADLYGLDILAEDIEDEDFNTTRFLVLSRDRTPLTGGSDYKTSLVFAVRHQPGSLVAALKAFGDHGVNMSKLESRPRRDRNWSYLFFADLESGLSDPALQAALSELMHSASFVKVLGSYPSAKESA